MDIKTFAVQTIGASVDRQLAPIKKTDEQGMMPDIGTRLVPCVLGSILGAVFWRKHRVLGFLGGGALGGCAYPLVSGDAQKAKQALLSIAYSGAAISASLMWKKHPVLGYIGGGLGATVVTYPIWKK